jgi:hypothetical protein
VRAALPASWSAPGRLWRTVVGNEPLWPDKLNPRATARIRPPHPRHLAGRFDHHCEPVQEALCGRFQDDDKLCVRFESLQREKNCLTGSYPLRCEHDWLLSHGGDGTRCNESGKTQRGERGCGDADARVEDQCDSRQESLYVAARRFCWSYLRPPKKPPVTQPMLMKRASNMQRRPSPDSSW